MALQQHDLMPVVAVRHPAPRRDRIVDRLESGGHRHFIPMTAEAANLFRALMRGNRRRALRLLTRLYDEQMPMTEIEQVVLAPAIAKLGELWLAGRINDRVFQRLGAMSEQIERELRHHMLQTQMRKAIPVRSLALSY